MKVRNTLIVTAITLALGTSVLTAKPILEENFPIESLPMIEQAPDGLFVSAPVVDNMTVMIVTVMNTLGEEVLNVRSKGEPVEMLAAGLPDGEYYYVIQTIYQSNSPLKMTGEEGFEQTKRESGSLYISNGEIQQLEFETNNLSDEEISLLEKAGNVGLAALGSLLNSAIGSANAADISSAPDGDFVLEDNSPEFFIYQNNNITSSAGRVLNWSLLFDNSGVGGQNQGFEIRDRINNQTVIDIQAGTNNDGAVEYRGNGDIHWAGSTMFLDESNGRLRIGGSGTPTADLELEDAFVNFRMTDSTDNSYTEFRTDQGFLRLLTNTGGGATTTPFELSLDAPSDSLVIDANGLVTIAGGANSSQNLLTIGSNATSRAQISLQDADGSVEIEYGQFDQSLQFERSGTTVIEFDLAGPSNSLSQEGADFGFGTSVPAAPIHVRRTNGTAQIQVEESQVGTSTLFELRNPGRTHFRLVNTTANTNWVFTNDGPRFFISRQGTGGVEFLLRDNGNAELAGTLTQNSDRNAKTAITRVDPREILDLVSKLPVSKWEYKDAKGEAHIGPMAQDFYAAFQLGGTEKGISSIDTAGVALAAIQALNEENNQLKASHRQLLAAYHAQQERLDKVDQLEQMVNQLIQSQEGKSVYTSLK